ncbi:putative outer membrane efflux protein [Ahrensia sp. R2A130]|nr:putative outer membrane efflux protein [Ahrensia sp. R2A130]
MVLMNNPLDMTKAVRPSRAAVPSLLLVAFASTALCTSFTTTSFAESLALRGSNADPAVAQPALRGTTTKQPEALAPLRLKPSLQTLSGARSASKTTSSRKVVKHASAKPAQVVAKRAETGQQMVAPEHMGAYNGASELGADPFEPGAPQSAAVRPANSPSLFAKAANVISGLLRRSSGSKKRDVDPIATGSIRTTHSSSHRSARQQVDLTDGPAKQSWVMEEVGETIVEVATNPAPLVALRNTIKADGDRTKVARLPSRPVMRRSMNHDVHDNIGLRGSRVAVADTVSSALRGSYVAKARLARAEVDRAQLRSALTAFLPRITGTAEASYSGDATTLNYRDNDAVSVGAEFTMPVFTSGVNFNTYRQARHASRASDYSYLAEENRVALEAVAAHINLRLNRRLERTLKGNVLATQKIATIARRLFAAGDASRTDIAIADANVASARAELDLATKSREEQRGDYESITGHKAPKDLLVGNYQRFVPETKEAAIESALANNPRLVAAFETADASDYAAKAAMGRFGPQVNLFGSFQRDIAGRSVETSPTGEGDENWSMGVRLRVPLFDATIAPTVNAARFEAVEARYRALDQGRLIKRQIDRQWTAYRSATRRVGIVQKQVTALKKSVEGARREFRAGFRPITDVLNDQVQLARAQLTLESVRHERMLSAYELAFTTGNPSLRRLAKSGQN